MDARSRKYLGQGRHGVSGSPRGRARLPVPSTPSPRGSPSTALPAPLLPWHHGVGSACTCILDRGPQVRGGHNLGEGLVPMAEGALPAPPTTLLAGNRVNRC